MICKLLAALAVVRIDCLPPWKPFAKTLLVLEIFGRQTLTELRMLLGRCGGRHGTDEDDERLHIACVHAGRRHIAILHLCAVVKKQIL